MLNIRTRIRTDLNPFKRIRFQIRLKNICTVFISGLSPRLPVPIRMCSVLLGSWGRVGDDHEVEIKR